jgi:hypothetical protein
MLKNMCVVLIFICALGCSQIDKISPFKNSSTNGTSTYTNGYEKSTSYDFPDIPIPRELNLEIKRSVVFESPVVKAGVLVYKGRVEPLSLFEYFVKKLPEYNWSLRSYFKYGKFIILFSKDDKDLVIRIIEKGYDTEVFIWVVPRTNLADFKETNGGAVQEEVIKP